MVGSHGGGSYTIIYISGEGLMEMDININFVLLHFVFWGKVIQNVQGQGEGHEKI